MEEIEQMTLETPQEEAKTPKKSRNQSLAISIEAKDGFKAVAQELGLTQDEALAHLTTLARQDIARSGLGGEEQQVAQDVEQLTKAINDKVLHAFARYNDLENTVALRYKDKIELQEQAILSHAGQTQELEQALVAKSAQGEDLTQQVAALTAQLEQVRPMTDEERYQLFLSHMAAKDEQVKFLLENQALFTFTFDNASHLREIMAQNTQQRPTENTAN